VRLGSESKPFLSQLLDPLQLRGCFRDDLPARGTHRGDCVLRAQSGRYEQPCGDHTGTPDALAAMDGNVPAFSEFAGEPVQKSTSVFGGRRHSTIGNWERKKTKLVLLDGARFATEV
jgi:hypothetical protein